MNANFQQIQTILRKLSRKQLNIVKSMVGDLISADEDRKYYASLSRKSAKQKSSKLPMFSDDEEPDESVMKGFNPVGRIKSTTQMERICCVGIGHQMRQLENHLDSIGEKHMHNEPPDDLDEY